MKDRDHVARFRNFLESNAPIGNYDGIPTLVVGNKHMVETLIGHGVVPQKTQRTRFPNMPQEYQRHFIRGCLDGDGGVYWDPTPSRGLSWQLNGTAELLESIRGILRQNAGVNTKAKLNPQPGTWRFTLPARNARNSLAWLYHGAHIYLPRKFAEFQRYMQFAIKDQRNLCHKRNWIRDDIPGYEPAVILHD